ncbi:MAG TPA: GH1 family beta-glucosidase [Streptosporangiaceae bacterium]|nr:GH1 family beta-glucosidase [Streptosporangiaceae bacterium]
MADLHFPPGFLFGASTSAYQIEGAAREDGRGPSIWDTFAAAPGRVTHGDTGDIACDHYHRVDSDLDLAAGLGLGCYRYSIAWPRVIPDGSGQVNKRGLDFYRRMTECILARGLTPMATLFHWDLPQPLQDAGGWACRDTVGRFCEYVDTVLGALGDLVPMWVTVNEPFCAGMIGYLQGRHAPGIVDLRSALAASHHLLLAHGEAMRQIRIAAPDASAGNSVLLSDISPATGAPEDVAAATRLDGHENRWFLDPVFRGTYPADLLDWYSARVPIDFIRDGDLRVISAPLDFSGVNYYETKTVVHDSDEPYHQARVLPATGRLTAGGIDASPAGLGRVLRRLRDEYPAVPLYITENGAPFHDYVDPGGKVNDTERVRYLDEHLTETLKAVHDGVDVRGYLVWSLLDNFEWADGYSRRFGLVFVDFGTQARIEKASATWYRKFIAEHAIEHAIEHEVSNGNAS